MDPATLVASASGLLLVTALASAIPTWRALRIDAAAALHMD